MRNLNLVKIISMLLALVIACAVFAGCNKKTANVTSSDVDSTVSQIEDIVEEPEDTESEPEEDEQIEWDDTEEPEDLESLEPEDDMIYDELTVYNSAYTNEEFLGFNFIHQLTNGYPDIYDRGYNDKQIALELDTMKDMRVKMIRSFYGSSLSWDPVKKTHDFENEWMTAFYKNCKNMEKLGIEVGITPQWSLDALVDGTDSLPEKGGWNQYSMGYMAFKEESGKTVVDVDKTAENFAKFIEDSIKAFQAHGVNNIRQMFCFTECNNIMRSAAEKPADTSTSLKERDYERLYPLFDKMVTAVHKGLKNAGVRNKYQIVGPCDNWRADDGSEPYSLLVKYTVENLSDVVDIIGSHNGYARAASYANDLYFDLPQMKQADPMKQAKAKGMDYWIDEFNVAINTVNAGDTAEGNKQPFKGTALSAMASGVMNMEDVSNVYLWALYDQLWPNHTGGGEFASNGIHMVGYLPSLTISTTPYPAYYALSLISKYIGQGKLYACEQGGSGLYISAIERNDGEITVMVTNYNVADVSYKVNFEKAVGGKNFYRYLYNPAEIKPAPGNATIAADAVAKKVTTTYVDTLPGMSFAVYTTEKPAK